MDVPLCTILTNCGKRWIQPIYLMRNSILTFVLWRNKLSILIHTTRRPNHFLSGTLKTEICSGKAYEVCIEMASTNCWNINIHSSRHLGVQVVDIHHYKTSLHPSTHMLKVIIQAFHPPNKRIVYLTDMIIASGNCLSPSQICRLNNCQLYLQAVTVSDITAKHRRHDSQLSTFENAMDIPLARYCSESNTVASSKSRKTLDRSLTVMNEGKN